MILVLLIPVITAIACYLIQSARLTGLTSMAGAAALVFASAPFILSAVQSPLTVMNGLFYMDALSAYVMALIVFLSLASALYSIGYLEHELAVGLTNAEGVRRYHALFHLFICTMLFVTVANNLAVMWMAIEATTIVSALLIGFGFRKRGLAIEAAWKYIILCTVGITFALLGTFITYYATTAVRGTEGTLDWTAIKGIADKLNPSTMKLAFIFILVGYGTKAGLAPLHNWLPDAHSQAPSPISALLSGILLNTAFYGIIRFVSLVEPSTGATFTGSLLILFGLVSLGIASVFILVQDNYKRLLAYSSIEHMGIISLGVGIGGPVGMYGALLHVLNHALSKPLLFFASGTIQGRYGSTRIEKVSGVLSSMPLLGTLTFIGALSLAGAPPFNIFISEFVILKAAVDRGLWYVLALSLLFVVTVFYGILSGFGKMLFTGPAPAAHGAAPVQSPVAGTWPARLSTMVMLVLAVLIIVLGLFVPDFLDRTIRTCVKIVGVS